MRLPVIGQIPRRLGRRLLALTVLVIATVAVATFAVWSQDRLPPESIVAGVAVGGLRTDEAADVLRDRLVPRLSQPVEIVVDGVSATVRPPRAGVTLDIAATVAALEPGPWPWDMLAVMFDRHETEPVPSVRPEDLSARLQEVAERLSRDAEPGSIGFEDGQPVARQPQPGVTVEPERLREVVLTTWASDDRKIRLPGEPVEPCLTGEELRMGVADIAAPAVSAPLRLNAPGSEIVVQPDVLAAHLTFTVGDECRLVPRLDEAGLREALTEQVQAVERDPRDAQITLQDGAPTVLPSSPGVQLPDGAVADAVRRALANGEHAATVVVEQPAAELTTAEARELGVVEKVASFTGEHPYAAYRVRNIHQAADYLDGALVLPGETLSYNEEVGERTPERGFVAGTIISGGRYQKAYGGGVSQLATVLFNAAYFAGVDIVEFHPHSFYISRYPEGRESTVYWGSKDVRFRNDTDNALLVTTSYDNTSITVTIWGTDRWDEVRSHTSDRYDIVPPDTREIDAEDDCLPQSGYPGFEVDVTRQLVEDGEVADEETFHTEYLPRNEVNCV